jgi:hypothetical protein
LLDFTFPALQKILHVNNHSGFILLDEGNKLNLVLAKEKDDLAKTGLLEAHSNGFGPLERARGMYPCRFFFLLA